MTTTPCVSPGKCGVSSHVIGSEAHRKCLSTATTTPKRAAVNLPPPLPLPSDKELIEREARGLRGRIASDRMEYLLSFPDDKREEELLRRGVPEDRVGAVNLKIEQVYGEEMAQNLQFLPALSATEKLDRGTFTKLTDSLAGDLRYLRPEDRDEFTNVKVKRDFASWANENNREVLTFLSEGNTDDDLIEAYRAEAIIGYSRLTGELKDGVRRIPVGDDQVYRTSVRDLEEGQLVNVLPALEELERYGRIPTISPEERDALRYDWQVVDSVTGNNSTYTVKTDQGTYEIDPKYRVDTILDN